MFFLPITKEQQESMRILSLQEVETYVLAKMTIGKKLFLSMGAALAAAGSPVLKAIYCANGTTETTPTAENYFHVYGTAACPQTNYQDYGTAIWIAHAYATPSGFRMVRGKVTP
jgi:hypothetical protein